MKIMLFTVAIAMFVFFNVLASSIKTLSTVDLYTIFSSQDVYPAISQSNQAKLNTLIDCISQGNNDCK